jgi:hypothetical protein
MPALAPISDAEVEANAAALAADILDHPLALQLDWGTIWVLIAIRAGDPAVPPPDAVPVLRLAMAAIDGAAIEIGLEEVR